MSKKKSKATRQADAQRAAERAAAIRREQQIKERRRRTIWVSLAVLAVIALAVGIVAVVQATRDTTGKPATPPAGAVDSYALPLGEAGAPVTVEVYEDFICPFCGEYESGSSEMLKEYAEAGDVQVQYRVISFLDEASSTDYSTRAANALAVVLDRAGREVALEFHALLFANQPEEDSAGLSDDRLVELAVEAGATEGAVRSGIDALEFEQWVVNARGAASDAGYNQTPTILVDGEQVEGDSIADLVDQTRADIEAALGS